MKERKKGIPLESNSLPTPYVTNFPLQTKTLPCISQISHYEQKLFPASHKFPTMNKNSSLIGERLTNQVCYIFQSEKYLGV